MPSQLTKIFIAVLSCFCCCCCRLAIGLEGGAGACLLFNDGQASRLDCRPSATPSDTAAAFTRHLFVGIRRADQLEHWELSPPLLSNQSVNSLPAGALAPLESRLRSDVALVLRRLNQPVLSLAALSDLPSLRHLVLADCNFTCLHAGALEAAPGLASLSLTANSRLACLQPGALASLGRLRRLRVTGSARLFRLDPGLFCGRPSAGLTELDLELPAGVQPPTPALASLTGLVHLRLSTNSAASIGAADDVAALELLPSLTSFICSLPDWRLRRLRLNNFALVDRLLAERLQATVEDFCGEAPMLTVAQHNGSSSCAGAGGCSDGCPPQPPPPLADNTAVTVKSEFLRLVTEEAGRPPQHRRHRQQVGQRRQSSQSQSDERSDRPNLPGTVLLTISAFVAGVVVSIYCVLVLQRRRRYLRTKRKKQARQRSWTLPSAPQSIGSVAEVAADSEGVPVRLVGFTRRGSCSLADSQLLLAVQRL